MVNINSIINSFSREFSQNYNSRNIVLSFNQFLDLVQQNPRQYMRSAPAYIMDTFDYFKQSETVDFNLFRIPRFHLFDLISERNGPIYGGEAVQNNLYYLISKLKSRGLVDKLICLHGPNGSAKTSTVEKIAIAMERYSETIEGASYRFSWVFPTDQDLHQGSIQRNQSIGFASSSLGDSSDSFAHLDANKILTRIGSEFKENPLFLLPKEFREKILQKWISEKEGILESDVNIHLIYFQMVYRKQIKKF